MEKDATVKINANNQTYYIPDSWTAKDIAKLFKNETVTITELTLSFPEIIIHFTLDKQGNLVSTPLTNREIKNLLKKYPALSMFQITANRTTTT